MNMPCLHIGSGTGSEGSKPIIHTEPSSQPNLKLELYALYGQKVTNGKFDCHIYCLKP
ncbi:hypothetical protein MA16_Dca013874 [Dendrobium catenatum]|uniref:Uncharacterized protein n=1 Tax=Dendrobium catenatum TaxID=906689 RepID=A0A2I0WCQ1_9ASPA|nr:hypothetical protein MA16_Dca013874 [Dendrobium catenatum]